MSAPDATPASVLLVDDEPRILSALHRLLRPAGYVIHTAESGQAALALLERQPVDLVISDMRMPEMDGARFLEFVRDRWPDITRLLLTGYADMTSTIAAINRGEIYRYIAKPWDDHELLLIIRDAFERRRLQAENVRLLALTQAQNEQLRELNAGLEQKVRERTAELEQVNSFLALANDKLKQNFLTSIKMFTGLIELRGGGMAGHSRRVADLARRLAQHLGVDPKGQQDVFLAGLLHDIGQIGFPDAMLSRPVVRLSGDDMALYRKHPLNGEAALMPLDELKEAARLIRSHHERFDGQGFPDGLIGLGIPLGARILALVSDYDALQHGALADRRLSVDEAKAMVAQGRGKRYDPQIVDALLELLGRPKDEAGLEREVRPADLRAGMVLARDLVGRDGVLLLAADYVLDSQLVKQIQDYARREALPLMLHIRTDKRELARPS